MTSHTGDFTSQGVTYLVNYTANAGDGSVANDVVLKVLAVPEPNTVVLLLGGLSSFVLTRRRKGIQNRVRETL